MTIKRLILSALTIIVVFLVGSSLLSSLQEPQITNRLQLYQTDLLLNATEALPETTTVAPTETATRDNLRPARTALLGEKPLETALEQYQTVRQSAATDLDQFQARLDRLQSEASLPEPAALSTQAPAISPQQQQLQAAIQQQRDLLNRLDVQIGILQAKQNQTETALETWQALVIRVAGSADAPSYRPVGSKPMVDTAQVLQGLWSDPPRIFPDTETQIQDNLDGWFRYQALGRLYQLQQRPEALSAVAATQQEAAQSALVRLAVIGTGPVLGFLIGIGTLVFLVGQWLLRGKQSLLVADADLAWETPWDWETVWQVLIVGFFFIGQIALPFLLSGLGISFAAFSNRARAAYALAFYLLMATSSLMVLYLSIRRYAPLPPDWFRLKRTNYWVWWAVGGYFSALPLMIGVSLINQQIWRGQGGSNPLLQIVLEEGDPIALGMFLSTAAIAAPIFEELLFRGFLLPSLTRYLPVWGAVLLSSLIFAIAHLSLSEVLPLTVLGAILGFVYVRSRSLLAPMLLHGLWNSVTMVGLFLLGSGFR